MESHALPGRATRRGGLLAAAIVALCGALLLGLAAGDADAKKKPKAPKLNVMTRNVYLGADLTPALQATGIDAAVEAGGEIANQVDRTNFPLRAQALAAEILAKQPDLIGLQEVAEWRTGPVDLGSVLSGTPTASTVEYDFLQLLLDQLNKTGNNYEVVVAKQEFDAELPVNDDGNGTGLAGADHDARLTMRDVILRRVESKAKVSNPNSGTFSTLLQVNIAGVLTLDVTRGWTATDVSLKGTKQFRFVNTHLEAFDSAASNTGNNGTYTRGNIRAAQAQELVAAGGPADPKPKGTVILVGDLNSDDDTVQDDGDRNAYNAIKAAGYVEVSTNDPLSCCLNDPNLASGSQADFDHQVDHILTDNKKVKLVSSSVVGLAPVSGLWPSDHAGVDSVLKMPKKKK